jgi:WD40 repeat protein
VNGHKIELRDNETMPPDVDPKAFSAYKLKDGDRINLAKTVFHVIIDSPIVEWNVGDIIFALYEVKEVLGADGMSKVYRVYHKRWRRDLAVKSPLSKLVSNPLAIENFERDVETWMNLGMYPNTVSCYYVRTLDGIPRVFVEYVDGTSLLDWIKKGKLYEGGPEKALERILDIAIQFAWGLDFAHDKGLIHKNVKPANVMMTQDGTAKVTDFGLANTSYGDRSLAYSSPELAAAKHTDTVGKKEREGLPKLDKRTDIWSWAVSVLEMFTGKVTWTTGAVAHKALTKYLKEGPENDSMPKMPDGVAEVLKRCFQQAPADRPHDMKEVAQALVAIYKTQTATGQVNLDYPRKVPKASDYLADGLNNQAVSLWDMGLQTEAMDYFKQAIVADETHLQAVYNHALLQWWAAEIEGTEVLMRLANCGNNPAVDQEALAELTAYIHAERLDDKSVREALKAFKGKYDALFSQIKIPHIKCQNTLAGHTGSVNSIAVSQDGRYVLSGSMDCTIKVWDLHTSQCLHTLVRHQNEVSSVAVSPDGLYIVSGSSDNTIKVWKLDTGQFIRSLNGHTDRVTSVAVSSDGRYVLSGSMDSTIKVWDIQTGQYLRTLEGHTGRVNSVAVSPEGRYVLSGSEDNTIKVWNIQTGQHLNTLEGHTNWVNSVTVSPDGLYILSGSRDNSIKVWAFETGQYLRTLEGHTNWVNSVAVSSDGRYAQSGCADDTIKVWDIDTGQCLRTLVGHADWVKSVAAIPDGLYAGISGSADNTIKVWEDISSATQMYISELQLSRSKVFTE